MPRKPLQGLIACGECGFADAEVREDRNSRAYWWCPDCGCQMFARTAEQDARIRARMRPVAGPAPAAKPPAPGPAPEPKPEPARPKRVGTLLEEN
jgi:predicted  nucleic acid-binding Zn-ribbon protein